jgi:hypothetical protein
MTPEEMIRSGEMQPISLHGIGFSGGEPRYRRWYERAWDWLMSQTVTNATTAHIPGTVDWHRKNIGLGRTWAIVENVTHESHGITFSMIPIDPWTFTLNEDPILVHAMFCCHNDRFVGNEWYQKDPCVGEPYCGWWNPKDAIQAIGLSESGVRYQSEADRPSDRLKTPQEGQS